MNLREQILSEHSKSNAVLIADWIGNNPQRFGALMQLLIKDEQKVVQRSAWVLSLVADKNPELITPYIEDMLALSARANVHVAVRRNLTRLLHKFPIPQNQHEAIMNLCFEWLMNPKETVAVRCYSMEILCNLSPTYPELKNELAHIIEDALVHQEVSAGFIASAKRNLKRLQ
jgi:hypothetical protein